MVWLLLRVVFVVATAVMLRLSAHGIDSGRTLALVVSQVLIMTAWRRRLGGQRSRRGAPARAIAHGLLTEGPWSFHARVRRDVDAGLSRSSRRAPRLRETDLAPLPEPVRRYLRVTRGVGQPRVHNYRVRFAGRIRSAPDAAWMSFEAEQQSFADEPTRLFLMRARMFGIPVEAFHRLTDGHATMQVKVAGGVPIVDARGDEMDRAETVTLFNDMCILAPVTLVGPGITWEPVDTSTSRARFTHRGHTITATLFFDTDGRLVNFDPTTAPRSSSPDGTSHEAEVLHSAAGLSRLRAATPRVRRGALAAARRGIHLR